jgi:hypothetical protein
MDSLNLFQIEQISHDVRREDISFSHLLEDLIDHVCCDVEYEMEHGLSFSDAYLKVKQKIGLHGLQKIQSDTLYAVDSKYRFMKNLMKISGVSGTVLLGFAALFKIMHWPGAGIMLTLGAFIMAFVFMPSSLSVLYKESKSGKRMLLFISGFLAGFCFILAVLFKVQHWPGAGYLILFADIFFVFLILFLLEKKLKDNPGSPKRAVYITGSVGALLYIVGLLFKFQHWPGASIMLLCGSLVLFLIAFPWYTWLSWKDHSFTHIMFIFLVPALIWVMVSGGLISLRVSGNFLAGFMRDYQRQEAVNQYLLTQNMALAGQGDSIQKRVRGEIHAISMEFYSLVELQKQQLVALSPATRKEADPKDPGFIVNEAYRQLDANTPLNYYADGSADRIKLVMGLGKYASFVTSVAGQNETLAAGLEGMFVPSSYLPDTTKKFANLLGSTLVQLSMLQNAILISESQLMKAQAGIPVTLIEESKNKK